MLNTGKMWYTRKTRYLWIVNLVAFIDDHCGYNLQNRYGGFKEGLCCVLRFVAQLFLTLCDAMDCSLPGSSVHGYSPGKDTGVGCHALLQGIFPTQWLNPDLLHCRQILYCLSHLGSPRILEWLAYPFSRGTFRTRNRTRISFIAGGFFTSWATREAPDWIGAGGLCVCLNPIRMFL